MAQVMAVPKSDTSSASKAARVNSSARDNKSNAQNSARNNLNRRNSNSSSARRVVKSKHRMMIRKNNVNYSAHSKDSSSRAAAQFV